MKQEIKIRSEIESDIPVIQRVNDLAFRRTEESELVAGLRALPEYDPRLSLISELDGVAIGHVLFFPLTIRSEGAEYPTLSLGPIAVLPAYQNQGVGGQLILLGHEVALAQGFDSVVLLGHPEYYPRFGYQLASKWGLTNPWEIHAEPWMAIELIPGALEGKQGRVVYPQPFFDAM